jgi:hypothetical protein
VNQKGNYYEVKIHFYGAHVCHAGVVFHHDKDFFKTSSDDKSVYIAIAQYNTGKKEWTWTPCLIDSATLLFQYGEKNKFAVIQEEWNKKLTSYETSKGFQKALRYLLTPQLLEEMCDAEFSSDSSEESSGSSSTDSSSSAVSEVVFTPKKKKKEKKGKEKAKNRYLGTF